MSRDYEPSVEAFLTAYRAAGLRPFAECTPVQAREQLAALRKAGPAGPEMARVEDVLVPSGATEIRARVYEPSALCPATVVYFHGGGWVVGDLETSDFAARHLAARTGARVVSVEYRLAPEHAFPTPIDDAEAGLRWTVDFVLRQERAGHPVIIAGDSAGANLAAVVCLRMRDGKGPRIDGQILIYPVTDCDFTTGSYIEYEADEPLSSGDMRWFWSHYVADVAMRTHPDAAPLRADLHDLPPAFVAVAEHDPLRDEGEAFATKLAEAGVPVQYKLYPGTVHGFFSLPHVVTPAQSLLADCADFITSLIPAG
ncbi:MAG: alpha/beta hydrolase [Novosphingobium sp.]